MSTNLDIAFPRLNQRDLAALTSRGQPRAVRAGEVLYTAGSTDVRFYVVLEGRLEIEDASGDTPRIVADIGRGQFTGEVNTMGSRATLVTARVVEDGRLVELDAAELRRAVDELPDLGETIIKAFLSRRDLLLELRVRGRQDHRLALLARRPSPSRLRHPERGAVHLDRPRRGRAGRCAAPPVRTSRPSDDADRDRRARDAREESLARASSRAAPASTSTVEADHVYDLVVVGAGPAGLAASVYAASEGLDVLTTDALAAAVRPAPARGSRTISASPPASRARS